MHTQRATHQKKDLLQSRREIRKVEASLVFLSQAQPELCFLVPELSLRFQLSLVNLRQSHSPLLCDQMREGFSKCQLNRFCSESFHVASLGLGPEKA